MRNDPPSTKPVTVVEDTPPLLRGIVADATDKPGIGALLDAEESEAGKNANGPSKAMRQQAPANGFHLLARQVTKTPLANFKRDTEQRNTLVRGGWAKRGCISMHVSSTGSGKSVLQTQAALCFHQGIACCGLCPTRPFTTWVIQSEDDDDRVASDRDSIVERLAKDYPQSDWSAALREIQFLGGFTGMTGANFIGALDCVLANAGDAKPDGIIINPLNAYFGGNLKDGADASAFFKGGELRHKETEGLEAVLKRHGVWGWIFAHTGKPPTPKELNAWLNDDFPEYKACGASEIADAVRSIITFLKVPEAEGVFTFTAGKNGRGLGWTDENGLPTNRQFFRWTKDGGSYWEPVPQNERPTIIGRDSGFKPPKPLQPPPRDEMPILLRVFGTFKSVMPKGAAAQAVRDAVNAERCQAVPPVKPMGRNDSVSLIDLAIGTGKIESLTCGGKTGTLCALPHVMTEYRNQPLPDMTADSPNARRGKRGGVAV